MSKIQVAKKISLILTIFRCLPLVTWTRMDCGYDEAGSQVYRPESDSSACEIKRDVTVSPSRLSMTMVPPRRRS